MCCKALCCKLLILRAWSSVVGEWVDADATSWREKSYYFDVFWSHELNEVFHDGIYTVLVEVAMVAEAEKVEL